MTETDPPLPLREIADRLVLHKLPSKSDKKGFRYLLAILKSSEIKAVVFFPDFLAEPIEISKDYWQRQGVDKLDSLYRRSQPDRVGNYIIKLRDVATQIYRRGAERTGSAAEDLEPLVLQLIQQANKSASVEVLESEWRRFAAERGISPLESSVVAEATSQGRGRPIKQSWEQVLEELAALLYLEFKLRNIDPPTQDHLAKTIHENLINLGHLDLPKPDTILNRLSIVHSRMRTLLEQHNLRKKK